MMLQLLHGGVRVLLVGSSPRRRDSRTKEAPRRRGGDSELKGLKGLSSTQPHEFKVGSVSSRRVFDLPLNGRRQGSESMSETMLCKRMSVCRLPFHPSERANLAMMSMRSEANVFEGNRMEKVCRAVLRGRVSLEEAPGDAMTVCDVCVCDRRWIIVRVGMR